MSEALEKEKEALEKEKEALQKKIVSLKQESKLLQFNVNITSNNAKIR